MASKLESVLITGANRGIGFQLLKQILTDLKPKIALATYRSSGNSKELHELAAANKNVRLIQLDLKNYTKFGDTAKIVENATGGAGLNLLINNAGISSKLVPLKNATVEEFHNSLQVNFLGPVLLTQALLPHLEKASSNASSAPKGIERAAVVNITAIMGSIGGNDAGGMNPYRCSKAALNAATKSMSVEFKRSGILAIAVHPGWVKTSMGGPRAPLEVEQGVAGVVNLLQNLNETHNGKFLQYDGSTLPW
jgi:NAD(P)-dependent dehydrogenase (short-subunit alcohol dehydrogenase family)